MYSFCRRQYATNSDIPVEAGVYYQNPYEKCQIETKNNVPANTSLYLGNMQCSCLKQRYASKSKGRILKPSQWSVLTEISQENN